MTQRQITRDESSKLSVNSVVRKETEVGSGSAVLPRLNRITGFTFAPLLNRHGAGVREAGKTIAKRVNTVCAPYTHICFFLGFPGFPGV